MIFHIGLAVIIGRKEYYCDLIALSAFLHAHSQPHKEFGL
ncbi:predicted protein [Sclerotinia sclerotiorum 1980 UF-70]|uniref:Uncharacterized protein n=1 Tax=Sclerotinia sclerotiorum (strain ATCC 18683 / 1980 / Ss-1) TaxID=665079 RepID=A7EP38_SCLS1|nr:predicted protein [Sclerotinia sclerotiorum 1980 UF-70]EDO04604.1 predicted protein [Sclerotinia sclerotiorum 1980 UF-70]